MRIAFFHDGDPRVARLRVELAGLGHEVLVVGPGVSVLRLPILFDQQRPDVIHSLGRGPIALMLGTWWRRALRHQGTRRAHDVDPGGPFVDGVVDGSLMGEHLVDAYYRLLRLRD
ncbi:MAG: hypothetical protein Q8O67_30100 [Deltaproteobacteria bacterium]|nr:hypothetical protein [Deltaproteobacteria bacterium]